MDQLFVSFLSSSNHLADAEIFLGVEGLFIHSLFIFSMAATTILANQSVSRPWPANVTFALKSAKYRFLVVFIPVRSSRRD